MNSAITSQAAQQQQQQQERLLHKENSRQQAYNSMPSSGSGRLNTRRRNAVMSLKSLHNVMGFVIGPYSEMEVNDLLGLFSVCGTISAFFAGIVATCITCVEMDEILAAQEYNNGHDYSNDFLMAAAYAMFGTFLNVMISTGLYASLSSLNFSHKDDDLLVEWFKSVCVWIYLMLFLIMLECFLVETMLGCLLPIKFPGMTESMKHDSSWYSIRILAAVLPGAVILMNVHFAMNHFVIVGKLEGKYSKTTRKEYSFIDDEEEGEDGWH